jgi:16S rRNA (guanine527-N7)-methyltransferase|tara:strand:- start:340 stop:996 length:657 start_codon:yes stop_codon:yes gene_type:complete
MASKNYLNVSQIQKRQLLTSGMDKLNLEYSADQLDQLLVYLDMLERWNKAYNLTAVREPMEMIKLHLLDSLAISSLLHGDRFIDVGTGAGLPGIPLAILNPDKHFTLLDSNGKKTRFLFQVKIELGLANINEVNERVEKYSPTHKYQAVLSRAFSSLTDMVINCQHLLTDNGWFLAMKGRLEQSELSGIPKGYKVVAEHPIKVPEVDGQRHLIKIQRI